MLDRWQRITEKKIAEASSLLRLLKAEGTRKKELQIVCSYINHMVSEYNKILKLATEDFQELDIMLKTTLCPECLNKECNCGEELCTN